MCKDKLPLPVFSLNDAILFLTRVNKVKLY